MNNTEKRLQRRGLLRAIGGLSTTLAIACIVATASEIYAEVSQETAAEIKVDSQEATSSVSSPLNEIRIDTVIINRNNVFTKKQAKKLWLYRYVNKMHITTRENVVRREILLGPGDIFDTSLAYETERNLRNKPFIFDSHVYLDTLENGAVALRIETIDKWSLSGGVEFRRQGGRSQIELGFTESNLLGYGHRAGLNYFVNEVDPDYLAAEFGVSRIFSSPYKFQMKINDNPLNREIVLRADRAFVRQSDKLGLRTQLRVFRRREAPKLIEADTVALIFEEGVDFQFVVEPRFGNYYTKFLPRLTYQYKNSNRDDAIIFDPFTRDSTGMISGPMGESFTLPIDSSRHETILTLGFQQYQFHRTSLINFQGRNEDINIISGLEFQFGQGRSRSWDGHLYDRWGFSARSGFKADGVFGLAVASRNFWNKSGEKIRRLTTARILVFQNSIPWVTFVSRFEYLSDSRIDSLDAVILDENAGVRGYPLLFASGDRRIVGNLEARFFSGITIFTSRLGGILHFDFGSIWDETEALSDSRLIWSAGSGLRIDLGQAGNGRIARFDLSYAELLRTWVISVGIGQYIK